MEITSKVFERLSSGLRIVTASDDAAGLSIALSLNADSRIFTQALNNMSDAISVTSIAEGALQQLSLISERQLELATQAANGTYSRKQRINMQREINALSEEFNRITETTTFNDISLFGNTSNSFVIQAGVTGSDHIQMSVGGELARTVGDGTFQARTTVTVANNTTAVTSADVNGDGKLDLLSTDASRVAVRFGNGDGTFGAVANYTAATGYIPWRIQTADMNNDGHLDVIVGDLESNLGILINRGNGTFNTATVSDNGGVYSGSANGLAIADMNGDGILDVTTANRGANVVSIWKGNGDGTLTLTTTLNNTPLGVVQDVVAGDFNNDGLGDLVVAHSGGTGTQEVLLQNSNGGFTTAFTFSSPVVSPYTNMRIADVNLDGNLDYALIGYNSSASYMYLGNGNGSFKSAQTISIGGGELPIGLNLSDLNGDGFSDMVIRNSDTSVYASINDGTGVFSSATAYTVGQNYKAGMGNAYDISTGDFDNNGTVDIITADINDNTLSLIRGNARAVTSIAHLDLTSTSSARTAITIVKGNQERVRKQLGMSGATEARITTAMNTVSAMRENYMAASSRIMDVDVAMESATLVRQRIFENIMSAVLSQTNQQQDLVLKLLRA